MKRTQSDSSKTLSTPRWSSSGRVSATEYVRAAEKFVQTKHYVEALDQLRQAQSFEPNNKYIVAIFERVLALQRRESPGNLNAVSAHSDGDADGGRYLSITVGPGFEDGIKPIENAIHAPESSHNDLIREFLSIARGYVQIGLPEAAFNALLKAYLLDPIDPEVIQCEQEIVPIWNRSREHKATVVDSAPEMLDEQQVGLLSDAPISAGSFEDTPGPTDPSSGMPLAIPEAGAEIPESDFQPIAVSSPESGDMIPGAPPPEPTSFNNIFPISMADQTDHSYDALPEFRVPHPDSSDSNKEGRPHRRSPEEETLRLEMLRQRKELERQERERDIYREASKLPRIFDDTQKDESDFHLSNTSDIAHPNPGFVRRLLKGKI